MPNIFWAELCAKPSVLVKARLEEVSFKAQFIFAEMATDNITSTFKNYKQPKVKVNFLQIISLVFLQDFGETSLPGRPTVKKQSTHLSPFDEITEFHSRKKQFLV